MKSDSFSEAMKLKLNELFQYTIDFLDSHNLRWWVAYGTAIGAVRHHGIIPWDDDIDIWMPREDYNTLLALKKELDDGYGICSLADNYYWLPFAKIYNKNTTTWEYKDIPFVFGVYIDIFPIDYIDMEMKEYSQFYHKIKRLYSRLESSYRTFDIRKYFKELCQLHIRSMCTHIKNDFSGFSSSKSLREKITQLEQRNSKHTGKYCAVFCEPRLSDGYFPAELFQSSIVVPFEEYSVKLPSGYHQLLTTIYGDYMTPPPIEKRVLTHGSQRYYCNLKEGLTIDEARERIKNGEHLVY